MPRRRGVRAASLTTSRWLHVAVRWACTCGARQLPSSHSRAPLVWFCQPAEPASASRTMFFTSAALQSGLCYAVPLGHISQLRLVSLLRQQLAVQAASRHVLEAGLELPAQAAVHHGHLQQRSQCAPEPHDAGHARLPVGQLHSCSAARCASDWPACGSTSRCLAASCRTRTKLPPKVTSLPNLSDCACTRVVQVRAISGLPALQSS